MRHFKSKSYRSARSLLHPSTGAAHVAGILVMLLLFAGMWILMTWTRELGRTQDELKLLHDKIGVLEQRITLLEHR